MTHTTLNTWIRVAGTVHVRAWVCAHSYSSWTKKKMCERVYSGWMDEEHKGTVALVERRVSN